jgi:NADPH:quinone reductase-like Zn-dependent oxidoreductase
MARASQKAHHMVTMRAVRIHQFGGIDELNLDTVPVPSPSGTQVLVRVHAAGVGPWDALVREGKSNLGQSLPVVIGSDISGVVEKLGAEVTDVSVGDEVFGLTSDQFTGGYAEYALADTSTIAQKPPSLTHVEAASVPVIGVTAWQMLFEYANVTARTRTLVLGAAGNVGAYAVQLGRNAGAEVIAVARTKDLDAVRALRPAQVVDARDPFPHADAIIDTVGGELLERSFDAISRGGIVVSSVRAPDAAKAAAHGVRTAYFIVQVRTLQLRELGAQIDAGKITPNVGDVLDLTGAREAHEMLAGHPHRPGKIVLRVDRP